MATRGGWDQLMVLDRRAAELARRTGATMLLLGEELAALADGGHHHALGFSSVGAYVQERCGRSAGWGREVVRIARRLGRWPRLRGCVIAGEVTWSAAELVLRALGRAQAGEAALAPGVLEHAETRWIEEAKRLTVRELRAAVVEAPALQTVGLVSGVGSSSTEEAGCDRAQLLAAERLAAERLAAERLAAERLAAERLAERDIALGDETAPAHRFLRRLPSHVLTLSVHAETAWWFQCARRVYERSVSDCGGRVRSTENFLLALLAEARVELEGQELGDEGALERWKSYVQQLAAWREESERRCDGQRRDLEAVGADASVGVEGSSSLNGGAPVEPVLDDRALDGTAPHDSTTDSPTIGGPTTTDSRVRELAAALARRDLELGRLAEWLQRAEACRRLGFASEAHYVRERMGLSYSQWKLRRHVARKLGDFPKTEAAVWASEIGLEAAALLLRVLSCACQQLGCDGGDLSGEQRRKRVAVEEAWLERARRRTFKHLREEVRAAELGAQQWDVLALPPTEETMQRILALEGRIKSGEVLFEGGDATESRTSVGEAGVCGGTACRSQACSGGASQSRTSVASRAWLDLRSELREAFAGAFLSVPGEPIERQSIRVRRRARRQVRLRLRLERDTLVEFRCLERLFRRQHRGDFLEFLCRHFLAVWAPAMSTKVKYAHVYRRDAFTCTSPVCERHDVQPHHLRFRSAGGGDEDENLTALCTWCHLEGVHGGRIRVVPPASQMDWDLGHGFLKVHGREVIR